jgi:hypothetical protein
VAFAWTHHYGVQGTLASLGTNTLTAAGLDSGANQTANDAMMLTGGGPTDWCGTTDFSNPGWNGCAFLITEGPGGISTCTSAIDPVPLDYAMVGSDAATPNIAKLAVLSVDFNEFFGYWLLDQAGADPGDGDPCFGDAFQANANPVSCLPIPPPVITGVTNVSSAGANVLMNIGDVTTLVNQAMLDDCNVAEDKATNCPRGLYQGRSLVFKHGACTKSAGDATDRRGWIYPAPPAAGTLIAASNFIQYSAEDANLNGILDAGEDTNANGVLDPLLFPSMSAVPNTSIRVNAVAGATDCIFFGLGILIDAGGGCLNPPTCSILGQKVISPAVSLDPIPVRAGSGTPVSDVVGQINTSKSQGKATVSWSTGVEMATAGFNVIGTKKNGAETKLNGSLIAAKEGTTGKGASYDVSFDASQLKGSSSVYVEIVKTDGSKERFGPASF